MPPPDTSLPVSDNGAEKSREYLDDFDRLLTKRAEAFSRQRGATRIDDADFNSAYRDLLATDRKDWRVTGIRILGTMLILAAGSAIAHGISVWTTGGLTARFLVVAGTILSIGGAALLHLPFRFGAK